MDAVQQFVPTVGTIPPQKFFIGGASKVDKLSNLFLITKFFISLKL
jgi:hypothetical protein